MKLGKRIMGLAAWLSVSAALSFAPESPAAEGVACIQVIAYAVDPVSGACRQFPTPCDVPAGWRPVRACPALTADELEGLWAIRAPGPTSDLRFLSLRSADGISVLVLLNAWSWNAYVTRLEGNRLPVTTFDGNGFNQWSVQFDSKYSGAIVGERCLPTSDGGPMPLASEPPAAGRARMDAAGAGTPSTGSLVPVGAPYIPSSTCRVPEGARIAIERLL